MAVKKEDIYHVPNIDGAEGGSREEFYDDECCAGFVAKYRYNETDFILESCVDVENYDNFCAAMYLMNGGIRSSNYKQVVEGIGKWGSSGLKFTSFGSADNLKKACLPDLNTMLAVKSLPHSTALKTAAQWVMLTAIAKSLRANARFVLSGYNKHCALGFMTEAVRGIKQVATVHGSFSIEQTTSKSVVNYNSGERVRLTTFNSTRRNYTYKPDSHITELQKNKAWTPAPTYSSSGYIPVQVDYTNLENM